MPQAMLLDDLQSFFTRYAQAWANGDRTEIMRFAVLPLTRWTSTKRCVLEDEEAAEDALAALLRRFEDNGIADARLASLAVDAVTPDSVDVTVHWELLDEDQEPVLGYDVGYTLVRISEHGWRIAMIREDEQNRALGFIESDAA